MRKSTRFINKEFDDEGRPFCLIPSCKEVCKQYKNGNYQNYCANHTWRQMKQHTSWRVLRNKVLRRDKYQCIKCGDNRKKIMVPVKAKEAEYILPGSFGRVKYKVSRKRRLITNLEADHIKEISDGGDQWNIDNIQTLCYKCHKEKTVLFNSRPRNN